jgi:hypothetical protein
LSDLIKLKRGLSSEWSQLNPVLKLGEPGYEKDTKKLKIGDGVTLWNDLPYIGSGTVDFEDVQDEVANFLKAGNNIVLDYDDPNNILTISASGLQPAGNYATLVNGLVPEDQLPSYVDDVLEFNNLASFPSPGETGKIYVALDSNKVYRWSGSTYIEISSGPSSSDDVPEGNGNLYYTKDRVNDLLQAGSNISLTYDNTNIVISATGLQPSGNYSVEGHTHSSNDITDFNSSVSGLLTVTNVSQGSGILLNENNKDFTISTDDSYIEDLIQDNFNTNLVAGSGIVLTYNEPNLTIGTSGLQPSGDYSVEGHTHTASNITDFNSSVSGLLPTIANSGDNRLLTSDGTSTGINAEDKLTFIPNHTTNGIGPSLIITEDSGQNNSFVKLKMYTNDSFDTPTTAAGRLQFEKYRGTQNNPSGVKNGDFLGAIRWLSPTFEGVQNTVVGRVLVMAEEEASESKPFVPTKIILNTSDGSTNGLANSLILDSSGTLTNSANGQFMGSVIIENGLSAPTPILNLGSVSGNVSISYGTDKQIQTLALNGTTTNFIKGADWPTVFSADVLLEITVSSTTTVLFSVVDDWYNPVPAFIPGKYLVLLRSMGSTIQGHYIGNKTN